MTETTYRDLKEKLKNDETRAEGLNEIKSILETAPNTEVSQIVKELGLTHILQCLNDSKNADLACEILKMCFASLATGHVVNNYTANLMFLMRHEKDAVRCLAIDEIYRTVNADPKLLPISENLDIFISVVQSIGDKNLGIATNAINIASNSDVITYPQILEELSTVLLGDTSSKCNGYEVIVNWSAKSPEYMDLCVKEGYIDKLLQEFKSPDVLYQLNILELLSKLAFSAHGLRYLIDHKVLNDLSDYITKINDHPMGNLLVPGLLKFFGVIASLYPREIFDNYPIIVDSLFSALNKKDITILPVALDTLGFIGSTIEGKLSLAGLGNKFISTIPEIGGYIKNSPTELRIKAMTCITNLIGYENDPEAPTSGPVDHRVTLMTREWFRSLSEQPPTMEMLFGFCKLPFTENKLAAYEFLDAVCQHQWGQELVVRTPGFLEYLLDRSADSCKETKESKYRIIRKLSKSAAFDANTILKFKKYVEEGPFFTEAGTVVAIEGEE